MKKLLLSSLVLVVLSGCGSYRPNTQKGWHLDEINKHTRQINRLDPIIFKENQEVMPMQMDNIADRLKLAG